MGMIPSPATTAAIAASAPHIHGDDSGTDGGTWMNCIVGTTDTTKRHYVATILLDGFSQQGVYIRLDNIPSTSTITFSNMKLQLGLNVVVSNLSQAADGMRFDISKKIEQKDLNGYATQTWTLDQIKLISDSIASLKTKIDNLSQ